MSAVYSEKWFLSQIKRNKEDGVYTKGVNDALNGRPEPTPEPEEG